MLPEGVPRVIPEFSARERGLPPPPSFNPWALVPYTPPEEVLLAATSKGKVRELGSDGSGEQQQSELLGMSVAQLHSAALLARAQADASAGVPHEQLQALLRQLRSRPELHYDGEAPLPDSSAGMAVEELPDAGEGGADLLPSSAPSADLMEE